MRVHGAVLTLLLLLPALLLAGPTPGHGQIGRCAVIKTSPALTASDPLTSTIRPKGGPVMWEDIAFANGGAI